jgi:hypothetical protein
LDELLLLLAQVAVFRLFTQVLVEGCLYSEKFCASLASRFEPIGVVETARVVGRVVRDGSQKCLVVVHRLVSVAELVRAAEPE